MAPPPRWTVPPELDGAPLDRALRTLASPAAGEPLSWNVARRHVASGKVRVEGQTVTQATAYVRAGQSLELVLHAPRPLEGATLPRGGRAPRGVSARPGELDAADALALITLRHFDSQLVVVEKPAGVATVPFDGSERNTLDALTAQLLARRAGPRGKARPSPLNVVHRLDKETTGLLVFARTVAALRHLKNQFRAHTVRRRYLALVHGHCTSRTLESRLVQDRGDGLRGSTNHRELGRHAVTHVKALEHLPGATLVECRLETGRTHQIRIHLAEEGHPLLGERVYTKGYAGALIAAPRVQLHAAELGFEHPSTGERLHYESELPRDFQDVLEQLRRARGASSAR